MSHPQLSLAEYFTRDHRAMDELWAEVEAPPATGAPESTAEAWQRFERALRTHLGMEEEIVFPAFEAATGMANSGPTQVMRSEHGQMRGLLDQMGQAMGRGSVDELLDLGDTLLMLIQQHNQKEEGMLYPMAEQALAGQWPSLLARLEAYRGER